MLKKFRNTLLALLLAGSVFPAAAQVKLGGNPAIINSSAILEMETNTQGLLLPRMLQSQMMGIASPVAGLVVYCTNCNPAGLRTYDGTSWGTVGITTVPPAGFSNNSVSCSGALTGKYYKGMAMNSSNTKNITITASTAGSYTASTNTANGVSFAGSGNLLSVGAGTVVTLRATGTPIDDGSFAYTVNIAGQTCSFNVVFIDRAIFACYNAVSNFSPGGNLVSALNGPGYPSYSGTYTLPYTAGSGESYGVATYFRFNLKLVRTAGTYSPNGGNVVYTLSQSYAGSSPFEIFNISEGCALSIPTNYVSTFAGQAGTFGSTNGTGSSARFGQPTGIETGVDGNVYVAEYGNHTIRKITPAGAVTTLAGNAGNPGSADGTGSAARFSFPEDVAVDTGGNLYVTDRGNNTIRKITPVGVVTTFAGSAGTTGSANGTGNAARFNFPVGIAVDVSKNLYVADAGNHTIRKITPAGTVTTFAGSAGNPGSADGTGSSARFNTPGGVTIDEIGNVYVSDRANYTIRKITPAGVVTTLAGSVGNSGSADGTGSSARFSNVYSITIDAGGTLFAADYDNSTIRKITPAGVVTTLAGSAGNPGSTDGAGSSARFDNPNGIAIDAAGIIYISDFSSYTIRKLHP